MGKHNFFACLLAWKVGVRAKICSWLYSEPAVSMLRYCRDAVQSHVSRVGKLMKLDSKGSFFSVFTLLTMAALVILVVTMYEHFIFKDPFGVAIGIICFYITGMVVLVIDQCGRG